VGVRVYVCATQSITRHFVRESVSSCVLVYSRACASVCICACECADVCVKTNASQIPQKSPMISGSLAERELQLKASYACSPLCNVSFLCLLRSGIHFESKHMCIYVHISKHVYLYSYLYLCVYMYSYIHIYEYTHLNVYIPIYTRVYTNR